MRRGIIGFQPLDHAVEAVPRMDVGQGQQPHLAGDGVHLGLEGYRAEINAVGDADGLLPENLGVVGKGDDAVDLPGQTAAEHPVDL